MSNITESAKWENEVYLLTRSDKVEGGRTGKANIQAAQLANRTLWLKVQLDSMQDEREFTFFCTPEDPDGTIAGLAGTPAGSLFRVAQGVESDAGFIYYLNDNGTAKPVNEIPGMNAVRDIISLNETTRYTTASDSGEYSFSTPYDDVTIDKEGNVIKYMLAGKLVTLIDSLFGRVSVDSLKVKGEEINPEDMLPPDDKDNLLSLSETTSFSKAGDEFEFSPYDQVLMDGQGNVISYMLGGKKVTLIESEYGALRARKLNVSGIDIDPNGTLPSIEKNNLMALSETTSFSKAGDEFEFNPKPWVVTDSEANILFDVEKYAEKSVKWDEAYEKSQNLEPQAINPLAPFTVTDAAGKSQVRAINTLTGEEIQVTRGNSNETSPRVEALDRVVWTSDRTDSAPGGIFYAALPDMKERAYIARPKLVGWGHSFMENARFMSRLSELTGLYGYNFGKSSLTSDAIAARQGGNRARYMPSGGVIPETGTVLLSPSAPGPLHAFGGGAMGSIACSFAGIDGLFGWDGINATFTRNNSGEAVTISTKTEIVVYPITTQAVINGAPAGVRYDLHDECINLLWPARNNITQDEQVIADSIAIASSLKNIGKRFIYLPDFPGAGENNGTANNLACKRLNATMKRLFPESYCEIDGVDLLQNFMNHHNPNSPGDLEDIANGVTPRSLRYDWLHPSQSLSNSLTPDYALYVGAEVNAEFVCQFMKRKGWV